MEKDGNDEKSAPDKMEWSRDLTGGGKSTDKAGMILMKGDE